MLELLIAFAKYVGSFINASKVKLDKELDDRFSCLTTDYNNKITEVSNNSSRVITAKNSDEEHKRTIETIIVDSNSKIDAHIGGKTLHLNTKRLVTVVEDSKCNKLNIAESGVKFRPKGNTEILLDPITKELNIGYNERSFTYESIDTSITHTINHKLDSYNLNITTLSKNIDGTYSSIYAGITINSKDQITVHLTEGSIILCMIKVVS